MVITVQRSDLNDNGDPCGEFVQSLKQEGYNVDALYNSGHIGIRKQLQKKTYAAVFVNIIIVSKACTGTHNLGIDIMNFWRLSISTLENFYFTSLGSPYILRKMPAVPNLVCTYSDDKWSQKAAVRWWLGQIEESGMCPVKVPKVRITPLGEMHYEMKPLG